MFCLVLNIIEIIIARSPTHRDTRIVGKSQLRVSGTLHLLSKNLALPKGC